MRKRQALEVGGGAGICHPLLIQRHYFANKGPSSQSHGFSSCHVWMWELDYKESWVPKNWCFWTVVWEKTPESPLDCKEIQPVHPKGNQPRMFIGRTDAEAETPILWPPDVKSWLTGKDPNAGKDWGQEEKGATEDEMVGWHHRLNSRGWTPGAGDGQGDLACCGSWGCKESDMTEQLNWTELSPQAIKQLTWILMESFRFSHKEENKGFNWPSVQFSSVQSLSRVRLFATPWIAAH